MTDHAPLTDEELAEMERRYPAIAYQPIPRLIADLRAARAEVERLRGDFTECEKVGMEWMRRARAAEAAIPPIHPTGQ